MKKELPSQDENPGGLHSRYIVTKANGQPVDKDAEYFVLRLDQNAKGPNHFAACRSAIMTYANAIESVLPVLALDLYARYGNNKTLSFARYMDSVTHMLTNIVGWYEFAAIRERNNSRHWADHYISGRSPVEGYNYDTNEASHHI